MLVSGRLRKVYEVHQQTKEVSGEKVTNFLFVNYLLHNTCTKYLLFILIFIIYNYNLYLSFNIYYL